MASSHNPHFGFPNPGIDPCPRMFGGTYFFACFRGVAMMRFTSSSVMGGKSVGSLGLAAIWNNMSKFSV